MQPLTFARRRSARATGALAVVLALLAALPAALAGQDARAAALTQVSNFGSNPGALQMFDYVSASAGSNAPLVLALHGCTQQDADYHNDSGWPEYADQWGFDLVFPQQPSSNDPTGCFDWYTSSADTRGNGEAASIAQMVQYMKAHYSIDPSRVYVTGLSAGAAMAATPAEGRPSRCIRSLGWVTDWPSTRARARLSAARPARTSSTTSARRTTRPCSGA